jgi:hypothetical protein
MDEGSMSSFFGAKLLRSCHLIWKIFQSNHWEIFPSLGVCENLGFDSGSEAKPASDAFPTLEFESHWRKHWAMANLLAPRRHTSDLIIVVRNMHAGSW